MVVFYIRHAEEEFTNDVTYLHDPKLTRKGKQMAYNKGRKLIKTYGPPSLIFCSPFRRTVESLKYMLYKVDQKIKTNYDVELSRYFSTSQKHNVALSDFAENAHVPVYESHADFGKRVEKFTNKMNDYIKSEKIIWVITHTTVYKKLASIYNIELPGDIPFCHSFKINEICTHCGKSH